MREIDQNVSVNNALSSSSHYRHSELRLAAVKPSGQTTIYLKIRAHGYEIVIILNYQEIIFIKNNYFLNAQTDVILLRVQILVIISHGHF